MTRTVKRTRINVTDKTKYRSLGYIHVHFGHKNFLGVGGKGVSPFSGMFALEICDGLARGGGRGNNQLLWHGLLLQCIFGTFIIYFSTYTWLKFVGGRKLSYIIPDRNRLRSKINTKFLVDVFTLFVIMKNEFKFNTL